NSPPHRTYTASFADMTNAGIYTRSLHDALPICCCKMLRLCSGVKDGVPKVDSRRSWIQRLAVGSEMCMNSAPMLRQYVSRSALSRSRKVMESALVKYVLVAA